MKILIIMISALTISLYAQSNKVNWWEFSSGFNLSKNANSEIVSEAGQNFVGVSRNGNTIVTGGFFSSHLKIFTGVNNMDAAVPGKYELYQNYPNPFNPSTKIIYSVPQSSNIVIKVFDILGNEIETLVNEEKPAGDYEIEFDGRNISSGVYFYRLRTGSYVETKKMVLMK